MKLAIHLTLSLAMLVGCLWMIWPTPDGRAALEAVFADLGWRHVPYFLGFYGLIAIVHVCRSWRWNYLLAPLGVRIPFGRMLAVSSAGFAAILLLPVRLGELVRPALIRKKGEVTASAALGTVAVERIADGVVVSLLVVGCFFALKRPDSPGWMMPTAYLALAGFSVLMLFLLFAMWRPRPTVRLALAMTLLPRFAPKLADRIEHKVLEVIRGFAVLRDPRNLLVFGAWSAAYWIANGLATWLLARGLGLPLSMVGAFATMGLVAVGISLPNAPGLVGQFQWLTMLGVSLELGAGATDKSSPLFGPVLAYAIFIHGLQVIWYVGAGLAAIATRHVSFSEVWRARSMEPDAPTPPASSTAGDEKLAPLPEARDVSAS
ncbi:MAG: flippase-like domain-containing protein [Kofleriaceae bacterium]|nr:flippase-like domain-containing protein [Kofleriaceae bacterium]MBP9168894.1 flippase-like domain-containing protein [Kofleriaceae bacterium]MBP9862142.1 flippase-like domain-containing protein [Kofleriaceae bacterium]